MIDFWERCCCPDPGYRLIRTTLAKVCSLSTAVHILVLSVTNLSLGKTGIVHRVAFSVVDGVRISELLRLVVSYPGLVTDR